MGNNYKKEFNPKLTAWLNARDYVSADWPDNLPHNIQREADIDIGKGYVLDMFGWPLDLLVIDCKYPPRG